jgi:hypothetical protein
VLFERSFADIWLHAPFRPSTGVEQFVKQFVEEGRFDAERFWEYVAEQLNGRTRKKATPSGKRRARAAGMR